MTCTVLPVFVSLQVITKLSQSARLHLRRLKFFLIITCNNGRI